MHGERDWQRQTAANTDLRSRRPFRNLPENGRAFPRSRWPGGMRRRLGPAAVVHPAMYAEAERIAIRLMHPVAGSGGTAALLAPGRSRSGCRWVRVVIPSSEAAFAPIPRRSLPATLPAPEPCRKRDGAGRRPVRCGLRSLRSAPVRCWDKCGCPM